MRWIVAPLLVLLVLAAPVASPVWADEAEEKAAVRRSAEWAADAVGLDLARSADVRSAGVQRIGVIVRPLGPPQRIVHTAISDALTRVPGLREVWPQQDVRRYVDLLFLQPDEIRYDAETILQLTGAFDAAQGLLLVNVEVDDDDPAGTRVDVELSLWGPRATKLWGAHHGHEVDLELVDELRALVESGRVTEALVRIDAVRERHPEWKVELGLLRSRAETLRTYARVLAGAHAAVAQSRIAEAYEAIRTLYDRGDASVHAALADLHGDLRAKLASSIAMWIDAGDLARAKETLAAVEAAHGDDIDLMALVAREYARIAGVEQAAREAARDAAEETERARERAEAQMRRAAANAEQAEVDAVLQAEWRKYVLFAGVGLGAVLFLALVLRLALHKRRRVARRNLGIDTLEHEADQADRVKLLLRKDEDVRAAMVRELDRAEDALADAHQRAQDRSRPKAARGLQEGSERLRELRRRVKLAPHGAARPFLKGKLPKRHLVELVSWLPAIAAHTGELTHEATAAHDAVRAGGDPRKNLELLGGLTQRIQGRLAEREAFFTTRT